MGPIKFSYAQLLGAWPADLIKQALLFISVTKHGNGPIIILHPAIMCALHDNIEFFVFPPLEFFSLCKIRGVILKTKKAQCYLVRD